jgi:hypothetical protein
LLEACDGSAIASLHRPDVSIDPANHKFELLDHFVMEIKSRSLVLYFGSDELVMIPSSIRCLAARFMYFEDSARSIEFESPSTIAEFGNSAFELCNCVEVKCIPASVEIIGNKCFRQCELLTSVTFESGSKLTTIGDLAFSGCDSLTTIIVPASVRRIGKHCFSSCLSLTQILFESQSQLYEIGDFGKCLLEWIDIPDSVHAIGSLPFAREKSSCVVMFGQESHLAVISVVDIRVYQYRRAFALYSEVSLRRFRELVTMSV